MFRRLDEACEGCFGCGLKHLDHSVAGQRNKSIKEQHSVIRDRLKVDLLYYWLYKASRLLFIGADFYFVSMR